MDEELPAAQRHLAAIAARERMMAADAGAKSRPVRLELSGREAMHDVYSHFVYQKAAAILLMVEAWNGEEHFRDALRSYLLHHRFAAASTDDLAAELGPASGAVLHSFLDRIGIPEVRASARCSAGVQPKLVLEQGASTELWTIPVCWKTDTASACTLLSSLTAEVDLPTCPAWIVPNAGGTGYYRSDWPADRVPPFDRLTAAERLTLVYDLAHSGAATVLLNSLVHDREPQVAAAAKASLAAR